MHFPVSGVDVFPLIPPLVAFLVSSVTASAGVSGAFLLLPFMVSVLGFTTPAVSPTNLIYNIVAIPGGLARYIREGRMAWPLTWVVIIATLPGVFVGAWIRIRYLPDPKAFKFFVGLVLLYLGVRLLYETTGRYLKSKEKTRNLEKKFRERVQQIKSESAGRIAAGLPPEAVVKTRSVSLRKIEYDFWGETFSFSTMVVFTLALVVGLIGGIYGIGGGAIIAPFVVSVLGLPVYTVAGAALAGTFLTSIAGVIVYHLLSLTAAGAQASVSPDWLLGALFGVGGLLGTYFGAYLQKYLPDRLIRGILGSLVTFLAVSYIMQFFM
ncbi:sulfite exporter TauE/SafE family protein [Desulfofundulus thermocisternus]|uniref:sulfite exporter TauE/SafE family protein n=1 Tax=Desulfofundulus thermocisternus TaxID=42471 RepID=UPI00217F0CC5|nr:sulfite exporter TauE/SafE family protein [Desulfofundulus thermocisternus]MCS5695336.1 sulfite exporter TauE/SafE family protein [Desulfofundulus thermocisternus]